LKYRKHVVITVMVILACILIGSVTNAASVSKKIDALYQDIKIVVNGKQVKTDREPFINKGSTYLPIRPVLEELGATVGWDSVNKIVKIDMKKEAPVSSQELEALRMQGYYKDAEINRLTKEIEDLKDEIKKLEKEEKKASKYKDLEDYLYDEYSTWERIRFNYYVYEYRNSVELIIDFDYDRYESRWDDIRERRIENWLGEIYDIADEIYDGKDFYGTIEDEYDGEVFVEFESYRGRLDIEFL